jgi:hypothetical protein
LLLLILLPLLPSLLLPAGQHAVINKHDSAVTKPNWTMHIAHAAAMIAAFCFLMPLSGLIARHRWVFTPKGQVS